jgi:uncharacterized SAM-binding protein YcdF (DUF218 family)
VFLFLSKTLDALLSPLTWALLLLLAGVLRRRDIPLWAPLGAIAILCFFSMEPVSNALVRRTELSAQRTDSERMTYDAVILLGGLLEDGPTHASGVPSYNEHVERLFATYDVLRSGHAKQAIISGGSLNPSSQVIESRALAAQLAAWGIEKDRLLTEDKSRNTRENAQFSKTIVDAHHFKTLLLVTSASHEPRAVGCFRAVGLDVDTLPVDYHSYDPSQTRGSFIPRADKLADSVAALRELIGRFIYRVVGYGKD